MRPVAVDGQGGLQKWLGSLIVGGFGIVAGRVWLASRLLDAGVTSVSALGVGLSILPQT